jgi:hypothetical protein
LAQGGLLCSSTEIFTPIEVIPPIEKTPPNKELPQTCTASQKKVPVPPIASPGRGKCWFCLGYLDGIGDPTEWCLCR